MNGWMLISMALGAMFIPWVMALRTAAREYQAIDAALMRTLTDLYAARDVHARALADKQRAIDALVATTQELQTALLSVASTRGIDRLITDIMRDASGRRHTLH